MYRSARSLVVASSALHFSAEVASDRVDGATYAAFNRAVREAVRRINDNNSAYMRYFIDYHVKRGETDVGLLEASDLRESRVVVTDPSPISADELQRTADWLKSWRMLEKTKTPTALVNDEVQHHAHIRAE
jgi:NitT/TauT family transport system substrate-binding protein